MKSESKSIPTDTLLFIINKKGNKGFCIISGDRRIPPVLAFSDYGHINKNDTIKGSGFAVFMSRLHAYYNAQLDKFQDRLDLLQLQWKYEKPIDYFEIETICSPPIDVYRTPNLVPVTWGQDTPYNKKAPIVEGSSAATGCVAVATAQILSAYKQPKQYKDLSINWELLTKYKSYDLYKEDAQVDSFVDQVSSLLRIVGDKLHNKWGISSTGARTKDVPAVLEDMGYYNPSKVTPYNYNGIIRSIDQRHPVIMAGCEECTKFWFITQCEECHAWVTDGYVVKEYTETYVLHDTKEVIGSKKIQYTLLHCNWGWDGWNNGYFIPNVFNALQPSEPDVSSLQASKPYYFRYRVRNILDIQADKYEMQ